MKANNGKYMEPMMVPEMVAVRFAMQLQCVPCTLFISSYNTFTFSCSPHSWGFVIRGLYWSAIHIHSLTYLISLYFCTWPPACCSYHAPTQGSSEGNELCVLAAYVGGRVWTCERNRHKLQSVHTSYETWRYMNVMQSSAFMRSQMHISKSQL